MDLRLLEIFCRVYKERSFSRAAEEIGLTQPTVSVHIRDLEEALGTPVFKRLGRDIEPTEAGHFLYEQAKPLVTLRRDVFEKMAAFLNRMEGQLTIGASSVPGEHLLPGRLSAFLADHASVKVRLRIGDTAQTIDDLRHGDIELGFVGGRRSDKDLLFESLATDSLVLLVPDTGPWQGLTEVSLSQLKALPLIVRESGSGTRQSLETALAEHKTKLSDMNVVAEMGSATAIRAAVRQGFGASFVSRTSIMAELEERISLTARVTELSTIRRTYYTVFSRKRVLTPVARAFLDHLRNRNPAAASSDTGGRRRRVRPARS